MNHEKKEYIDGIFDYCDRWCERCRFTASCKLFHIESRIQTHQLLNDGEMPDAEDIFDFETDDDEDQQNEFSEEYFWDDEEFDFEEDDANAFLHIEEDDEQSEKIYPVEVLADEYMKKAGDFLKNLDEKFNFSKADINKKKEPNYKELLNNFDIVAWYHMFILVKIKRALDDKYDSHDMGEDFKEFMDYDMNGTARIAAIAVKRSQKALQCFLSVLEEYSNEISDMMILLGKILNLMDQVFPDYKKFKRPGFDTK